MNENVKTITSPELYDPRDNIGKKVFLAGSIEQDTATKWQTDLIDYIKRHTSDRRVTLFNPRRDEWDASWEQDKENPEFYKQVTWELGALDHADVIALYLDPNTKSPISLIELGIHVKDRNHINGTSKLVVCCPKGFWRKGNVDITCSRYGVQCFSSMDAWKTEIVNRIVH